MRFQLSEVFKSSQIHSCRKCSGDYQGLNGRGEWQVAVVSKASRCYGDNTLGMTVGTATDATELC